MRIEMPRLASALSRLQPVTASDAMPVGETVAPLVRRWRALPADDVVVGRSERGGPPLPDHWAEDEPTSGTECGMRPCACEGLDRVSAAVVATDVEEEARRLLQLIGVVGHDLRGPLTAISGYAQMARRSSATSDWRAQALDTIVDLAHRMDRMLRDLLDAACAGNDALTVHPTPMDLAALTRRVVAGCRASAPERNIVLDCPESLVGTWDEDRLAQVVENLVGNAVKYSPDGTDVRVSLGMDGDRAVIAVADEGIGIAADQLDRLFLPFSRLATDREGAGLGLYVSAAAIQAHGGRLWAESDGLGRGATFIVSLPIAPAPEPAA